MQFCREKPKSDRVPLPNHYLFFKTLNSSEPIARKNGNCWCSKFLNINSAYQNRDSPQLVSRYNIFHKISPNTIPIRLILCMFQISEYCQLGASSYLFFIIEDRGYQIRFDTIKVWNYRYASINQI